MPLASPSGRKWPTGGFLTGLRLPLGCSRPSPSGHESTRLGWLAVVLLRLRSTHTARTYAVRLIRRPTLPANGTCGALFLTHPADPASQSGLRSEHRSTPVPGTPYPVPRPPCPCHRAEKTEVAMAGSALVEPRGLLSHLVCPPSGVTGHGRRNGVL
ncbi:hypothetical protein B0T22DRAFT_248968 [Podospora appendiculata]|uniref:Uncharacterized protein n=1 Tax=Podospora appendiculata TaxID=314037 RepID=A0AAE0X2H8_9PEZI|nr:hypothetical protein B0T22DRAFT_248968 [Podospora appendiculata]